MIQILTRNNYILNMWYF